jgi:hypothetical protein
MRNILYYVIYLLIIINSCASNDHQDKLSIKEKYFTNLFDNYSDDSIRAVNFEVAYNNNSTAPNYIVYKAKDLNTGSIKEICSEAPFLSGALHRELEIEYDEKGIKYIDSIALAQNIYEFKKKEALDNINFFEYPNYERILEIAKGLDLEYYHNKFGQNNVPELKYFASDSGFVQLTFCHIMFNCGILTRRDCIAGNNIYFGNPIDL